VNKKLRNHGEATPTLKHNHTTTISENQAEPQKANKNNAQDGNHQGKKGLHLNTNAIHANLNHHSPTNSEEEEAEDTDEKKSYGTRSHRK
jgi:hypothetical protein